MKTLVKAIEMIIGSLLWYLSLSHFNKMPKWFQNWWASKNCSSACQLFQAEKGGLLVYTICDEEDPDHDVADHFMNIMERDSFMLLDRFGNVVFSQADDDRFHIGDKIELGERTYTIVQFAEKFDEFGIRTFQDLVKRYRQHLSQVK